jgi:hypothetical protein
MIPNPGFLEEWASCVPPAFSWCRPELSSFLNSFCRPRPGLELHVSGSGVRLRGEYQSITFNIVPVGVDDHESSVWLEVFISNVGMTFSLVGLRDRGRPAWADLRIRRHYRNNGCLDRQGRSFGNRPRIRDRARHMAVQASHVLAERAAKDVMGS